MILKSCVQTTKGSVDFLYIFSTYANIVSALMKSLDDSKPSVQYRGGPIAFVLREQVSQIFHSGEREGNRYECGPCAS